VLAISNPEDGDCGDRHFQERIPYGSFVPCVNAI
jgi:hypothetical protein